MKREYGMCIRAGNNSSGEKNKSLLPTVEFFIVIWCIQGPNVGRENEIKSKFFFFFKTFFVEWDECELKQ